MAGRMKPATVPVRRISNGKTEIKLVVSESQLRQLKKRMKACGLSSLGETVVKLLQMHEVFKE